MSRKVYKPDEIRVVGTNDGRVRWSLYQRGRQIGVCQVPADLVTFHTDGRMEATATIDFSEDEA